MNKKITTLLLTCFAYVLTVCAQNISVSAPTHVATGENFRVSYTIANVSVDESVRLPSLRSGSDSWSVHIAAVELSDCERTYQPLVVDNLYLHALCGESWLIHHRCSTRQGRRQDNRLAAIPHTGVGHHTQQRFVGAKYAR